MVRDVFGTQDWWFELPEGQPEGVLIVRNHPSSDGERDFAGHIALRQCEDCDVPFPSVSDCPGINANPQCSPGDNDWP